MTREDIMDALQEIFQDVFDDDTLTIGDDTTAADIEDWDSLEHINLVVAIEKRFQIKFVLDEVGKMKNVGEMADTVLKKIS